MTETTIKLLKTLNRFVYNFIGFYLAYLSKLN